MRALPRFSPRRFLTQNVRKGRKPAFALMAGIGGKLPRAVTPEPFRNSR